MSGIQAWCQREAGATLELTPKSKSGRVAFIAGLLIKKDDGRTEMNGDSMNVGR